MCDRLAVLRCAVQAFCFIVAKKRKLLFHLVSFEEEAARDQGCPPVFVCACVCITPRVCVRVVCMCVGPRERERGERASERDARVKQIRRAAQETAAFGHVLETEAGRPQRLRTEKITRKKTYFASPLPSIQRVSVLLILFRGGFFFVCLASPNLLDKFSR